MPLRLVTVALVLLAIGCAIFAPFMFGDHVLLYKGIGSDSLNDDYPIFVHLSEYLRTGSLPFWSFHLGMGQSLYPSAGLLLANPVVWLPKEAIAEGLVWQHVLKFMVAGLLFYRFLELRGLNFRSALGGAALLAFSTYMCFGACWSVAANEVVGFSFLLFAIESALMRGRWFYLPLAVAFLALVTVFHLYLGAVLLCLYVPARIIALQGWQPRRVWRTGLPLAGAAFLGCGLAAIVVLDGTAAIFNSPRGPGSASGSLAAQPVFELESSLHYITALFRRFSADMLGTGLEFRGWYNYFEAPANYCGLICLLLLPQAFVQATRRQRILYGLFLGYLIVPVVFPWFRYLFWAFQGDYFRVYSLFGVFGVIALAMLALSRYVERRTLNPLVLGATLAALLLVLWLPVPEVQSLLVPELQWTATLVLATHALLLGAGHFLRRETLFAWLVLGVSAATMIRLDRITVAERGVLLKSELEARAGYNDHTIDAVRDLPPVDREFYRVTKLYSSSPAIHASLNDAMVFGYFGTSSYSSFNSLEYIRFLVAMDVLPQNPTEFDTRWAKGLSERPLLAAFANEKYVLTKDPRPLEGDGSYTFLRRYADVHVFEAKNFVPFGVPFRRYVRQSEFLTWPTSAKEHALFHAAIIRDDDLAAGRPAAQTQLLRLDLGELARIVEREPLSSVTAKHRAHAFRLESFAHNRIRGTITLEHDALLVFQMPFDPGWRARVGAASAPVLKVDAGLTGLALKAGEHDLELRFRPRFLPLGATITLVSAAFFGFALYRRRRIHPAADALPASLLPVDRRHAPVAAE